MFRVRKWWPLEGLRCIVGSAVYATVAYIIESGCRIKVWRVEWDPRQGLGNWRCCMEGKVPDLIFAKRAIISRNTCTQKRVVSSHHNQDHNHKSESVHSPVSTHTTDFADNSTNAGITTNKTTSQNP